jgi:hypothetical protein
MTTITAMLSRLKTRYAINEPWATLLRSFIEIDTGETIPAATRSGLVVCPSQYEQSQSGVKEIPPYLCRAAFDSSESGQHGLECGVAALPDSEVDGERAAENDNSYGASPQQETGQGVSVYAAPYTIPDQHWI